jgi:hypothetical protein
VVAIVKERFRDLVERPIEAYFCHEDTVPPKHGTM